MRHLKAGKKLGRSPAHRKALYRNLTMALLQNERIVTTLAKAKAVRPFVEKLITLARKGTLHARRMAIARMGPAGDALVDPSDKAGADHRTVIQKLFEDLGPRFQDRPGGYTRIVKLHTRRLGDGGDTAVLELLKEGEAKVRLREPSPIAPQIEEEEQEEQPQDEAPEQEPVAEDGSSTESESEEKDIK